MELTDTRRNIVEAYSKARQNNDTDLKISFLAFLNVIYEDKGCPQQTTLIGGYTRGQYKRAIKCMRSAQAAALRGNDPATAANFDRSVRYIREHCLSRSKENA